MKKILLITAISAVIFQSCKKEVNRDFRDSMVGSWDVYQTISVPSLGLI